ncbi:hypothetical protein ACPW96_19405 [Micromonospora sp. DT81.3]|uniref:hypothetical protein n=1 Tax=Micromonospora sp. DT81.3 TaxID=3416523 RepID=UPI003CEC1405
MAVLALVAVLACSTCVSCTSEPPERSEPPTSAYQQLTSRIGVNGEISLDLALDAFATVVGPVPGGNRIDSSTIGTTSGTFAVRWVLGHLASLTEDQLTAIRAALAPGSDDGLIELSQDIQKYTEELAAELADAFPDFAPMPFEVYAMSEPYQEDGLSDLEIEATATPGPGSKLHGDFDLCTIQVYPVAIENFRNRESDPDGAGEHFRFIMTHELMHCHQYALAPIVERVARMPDWISEGSAEWGAYVMSAPTYPPGTDDWWAGFFETPKTPLFQRTYDALGFFFESDRPWQLLQDAYALDWAVESRNQDVLDLLRRESDGLALSDWAGNFMQDPDLGPAWVTDEIGVRIDDPLHNPEAPGESALPVGESYAFHVPPFAFTHVRIRLAEQIDVVALTTSAFGKVNWSPPQNQSNDGSYDTAFPDTGETSYYCVDRDACRCPQGSRLKVELGMRDTDSIIAAWFGSNGSDSTVSLRSYTMAEAEETLCEKDETPPESDGSGGNCSLLTEDQLQHEVGMDMRLSPVSDDTICLWWSRTFADTESFVLVGLTPGHPPHTDTWAEFSEHHESEPGVDCTTLAASRQCVDQSEADETFLWGWSGPGSIYGVQIGAGSSASAAIATPERRVQTAVALADEAGLP